MVSIALQQNLYDAIVDQDWGRARTLLQQIPEGKHLPRTPPVGREVSLARLASFFPLMPDDVVRSLMGAFPDLGPSNEWISGEVATPLHFFATSADEFGPRHVLVVAELDPLQLVSPGSVTRITPIELLMHSSNKEGSHAAECAEMLPELLRLCPAAAEYRCYGRSFLHLAVALNDGVRAVQAIVDGCPSLLDAVDENGMTALHSAALQGDVSLDIALYLLGRSPSSAVSKRGQFSFTTLHYAAMSVFPCGQFIDAAVSACPEACRMQGVHEITPLVALISAHKDALFPDTFDPEEITMLTRLGNCAWTLYSALPADERPRIHSLLREEEFPMDIAPSVFCAARAQLSQPDEQGNLPIHILANRPRGWDDERLYTAAVKTIIHLYPEGCSIVDAQGRLPLELMKRAGHTLRHGMDPLLHAHPAAVMDLNMHFISLLCLFAHLGRLEIDPLYRFLQGAPETIKIIRDASQE